MKQYFGEILAGKKLKNRVLVAKDSHEEKKNQYRCSQILGKKLRMIYSLEVPNLARQIFRTFFMKGANLTGSIQTNIEKNILDKCKTWQEIFRQIFMASAKPGGCSRLRLPRHSQRKCSIVLQSGLQILDFLFQILDFGF